MIDVRKFFNILRFPCIINGIWGSVIDKGHQAVSLPVEGNKVFDPVHVYVDLSELAGVHSSGKRIDVVLGIDPFNTYFFCGFLGDSDRGKKNAHKEHD